MIACTLDAAYVEHDTYTMLAILMDTMLPWFDTGSKPRRPGTSNVRASVDRHAFVAVARPDRRNNCGPSPRRCRPSAHARRTHACRPKTRACLASRRPRKRYKPVWAESCLSI